MFIDCVSDLQCIIKIKVCFTPFSKFNLWKMEKAALDDLRARCGSEFMRLSETYEGAAPLRDSDTTNQTLQSILK